MATPSHKPPNRVLPTIPSRRSSGDNQKEKAPKGRKATRIERVRQQYQYTELTPDHTRLLILHPREDDDERIDVTLMEVAFNNLGKENRASTRGSPEKAIEYEALSYHWNYGFDDEETLKPIHIRNDGNRMHAQNVAPSASSYAAEQPPRSVKQIVDSLTSKTMFVKPNLHYALRRLRLKTTPVTLWVDALCINQDHQPEKEAQVSRMREIYSRATSVAIWLGESDERTQKAMKFVKEVISLSTLNKLVADEKRVNDWRNLIHLSKRSWFSRRWVIQELAFASNATVHCGAETIHWNDFRDAISIFSQEFERIRLLFKRSAEYDHDFYAIGELEPLSAKVLVDTINNIFRKKKRGALREPMQSLEYLVSTLSGFDSSDPRDTIHALGNIAKESTRTTRDSSPDKLLPPPDYRKTLLQVYADWVWWIIKTTDSVDIICRRWAIAERTREDVKMDVNYPRYSALPSWIQQIENPLGHGSPIKAANGRIHGDSFVGLPGRKSYDACNGRSADVFFSCDRKASGRSECSEASIHRQPNAESGNKPSRDGPATESTEVNQSQDDGASSTSTTRKRQRSDDGASGSANVRQKRAKTGQDGPAKETGACKGKANYPRGKNSYQRSEASGSGSSLTSNLSQASQDEFDRAECRVIDQLVDEGRDASMYVTGILVGKVGDCTEPIADGVIPSKAVRKLSRASKDDPDMMWRTLVAERGDHGENPPAWYQRACLECVVSHTSNGHINTRDLYQKSTHPDHVRKYLQRVQAVTWDRSFLEIHSQDKKTKLHGFGPGKSKKGDLVCILFGCSVPCVLRPRWDEVIGEYYRFIGEAYVYGIMDGEAVSSLTEEEIEAEQKEFRLL